MENKNFYSVAIGKMARSGSFVKQFDFVCASEKKWIDVRNHYIQKYKGFDVDVKNVEVIDEPIIVSDDFGFNPESKEISLLKKELDELKSSKIKSSFIIEIRDHSLTGEAKELYKKIDADRGQLKAETKQLKEIIEKNIVEKYGSFCYGAKLSSCFEDSNISKCEIYLNGKLTEL